ncbi:hypothetical protein DSO57_1030955 [Entomophthora muscae]|uniref:Uncharacterized protein n=1 Tax=Entomophthora muscae TaxID=34485 RepID=A0ACC2UAL8_9FUNG|nr:hypothetical protein DSO57_1030955 [Entomophthora muscae]
MIPLGKEAPHISMLVSTTTKHTTSFDVLLLCLSHLHAAFDSKLSDGLPENSQFDFEFKITVNLVKEQCLEEWTNDMEAKGQIFRKSSSIALHCCLFKSLMDHYACENPHMRSFEVKG